MLEMVLLWPSQGTVSATSTGRPAVCRKKVPARQEGRRDLQLRKQRTTKKQEQSKGSYAEPHPHSVHQLVYVSTRSVLSHASSLVVSSSSRDNGLVVIEASAEKMPANCTAGLCVAEPAFDGSNASAEGIESLLGGHSKCATCSRTVEDITLTQGIGIHVRGRKRVAVQELPTSHNDSGTQSIWRKVTTCKVEDEIMDENSMS
jgi:hypothetical protein